MMNHFFWDIRDSALLHQVQMKLIQNYDMELVC